MMEQKPLFDAGPVKHKHCFVYCGDNRCNCEKNPKYRRMNLRDVPSPDEPKEDFPQDEE